MCYRVVLTDADLHPPDESAETILRACGATLDARVCREADALRAFCADAHAVVCARARITRPVIRAMSCCRIIARLGTGWDNVDGRAAGEAGIPVTNVPDFCTESVADHTMALMLACVRKIVRLDQAVRRGVWNADDVMPTFGLGGKTLGLVGFGSIGRAVAQRALAFGMRVSYYDPAASRAHDPGIVAHPSLDALLPQADVVSLHLPSNEKTRGLIGHREFRLMKPTAILINCARGEVLVETALCHALTTGLISAAGLDVLESEPPTVDHPLLALPNVTLSPHCAAHTEETLGALRRRAYEEVARALTGEPLLHVVNRDFLQAARPSLE